MLRAKTLIAGLCAGLALSAVALAADDKAATPPPTPAAAAPVTPAAIPPAPAAMPVPDLPAINKTELEGGLISEDLKIGDGAEIKPNAWVVAHYHGTLKADGKIFDSSYQRGQPIAFPLSGVIQGWQKGVPGMKIGGIRRLTIPAALGYGERGAGDSIPPNSDLVFIVQIVDALITEDIKEGTGEAASQAFIAVTTHRVLDAQGNEVEKVDASNPYIWLPGEWQGMQMGLEGMKVGGKRKILIPKEMNVTPPQLETKRPKGVPLVVEVELVNLRNLPQNPGAPRR
jgi:FKBP-type peptidyl-prolyl cis-trans isomerase